MANSLIARKRIRKNFGKIAEVAKMPNLIEVQKTSYDQFLQLGIPVSQRSNTGLQEVFTSVFPIRDFSERAELQFVRYEPEEPKYRTILSLPTRSLKLWPLLYPEPESSAGVP